MALFKITTTRSFRGSSIIIEPGMSVQVSTPYPVNPINVDGGRLVNDACLRIYGIDLKRAGILNNAYLSAIQIG